ncbi:AAA family ATPase [Roseomonas gilardii]|uniref:AAA family ATPase n=1 Tax=Roseomonas gilardii TaxID=257708 RepID=UPI0011A3E395|nr:AAA family ATPase [Roseomonas gilardii]
MPALRSIPVYEGLDEEDRTRLLADISAAYTRAAAVAPSLDEDDTDADPTTEPDINFLREVPELSKLLGIDPAVYRQVNAALKAGKRHLMLYGPPGTGKTELAQHIAGVLSDGAWRMVTGSADWSSQDIIGGYQPLGEGKVGFVPGILLQNFHRPLVIDELNRCDIDKVLGPLFTVLSGQPTTLPYRTNVADPTSPAHVILPRAKPAAAAHEHAPGDGWRLIATINTVDKAALYQMSFALARRFGWIFVDAPRDQRSFLTEFLVREHLADAEPAADAPLPLATVWAAVNEVRVIGAAPIIDAAKTIYSSGDAFDFASTPTLPKQQQAYMDAFSLYLLPMLDGISRQEASGIASKVSIALALPESERGELERRLLSIAT